MHIQLCSSPICTSSIVLITTAHKASLQSVPKMTIYENKLIPIIPKSCCYKITYLQILINWTVLVFQNPHTYSQDISHISCLNFHLHGLSSLTLYGHYWPTYDVLSLILLLSFSFFVLCIALLLIFGSVSFPGLSF